MCSDYIIAAGSGRFQSTEGARHAYTELFDLEKEEWIQTLGYPVEYSPYYTTNHNYAVINIESDFYFFEGNTKRNTVYSFNPHKRWRLVGRLQQYRSEHNVLFVNNVFVVVGGYNHWRRDRVSTKFLNTLLLIQ